MFPKDADRMANSVDPDQSECSLVCPDLSVPKLRVIMVLKPVSRKTVKEHK